MTIGIMHTADNHIGLHFHSYPDNVRQDLIAERFNALEGLVHQANARRADFFVIAGDLFDAIGVSTTNIRQCVEKLAQFEGVAVIVVPGNHDYYQGPQTELWKRFKQEAEDQTNIHLLHEPKVQSYEVRDEVVHFFPCPCPTRTGAEPVIGWVQQAASEMKGLKIGIAHGNVTGLGRDDDHRYFNMEPDALRAAGLATWLLGHIHVPYPDTTRGQSSDYFMAGTHTPDSLKCRHTGSAWLIECEGDAVTSYEQVSAGKLAFVRIERELNNMADVEALQSACGPLDQDGTLLDLQLTGCLTSDEQGALNELLEQLRKQFFHFRCSNHSQDRLTAEEIATQYPEGTLAHRLLTTLIGDETHPQAAALAYDLIEEARES